MTYEEALLWGLENGLTLRFWKEDDGYRVWVCKLIDADTGERLLIDEVHRDQASALSSITEGVKMIAEQFAVCDAPAPMPVLRLVHSA